MAVLSSRQAKMRKITNGGQMVQDHSADVADHNRDGGLVAKRSASRSVFGWKYIDIHPRCPPRLEPSLLSGPYSSILPSLVY